MADRPSASASRVERPRMRSEHQTPCVPVGPKVGRPRSKLVFQSKVKDSTKKNLVKQKSVNTTPPLEQDIIVKIDPEDQEFPHPADQLPDLPLVELDQVPNNNNNPQPNQIPDPQLNPPNQPLDLPTEEPNQPNQPNQLPNQPNQPQNPPIELPNQANLPPNKPPNLPANLPDPMDNQQQLNWSYFKPEFAGKPEETWKHIF